MATLLFLDNVFYYISEIQLIDGAVLYIYVLTNILPPGFLNYWQRDVEVYSCDSGFMYYSMQFYQIL